ncbi:uncharacterized protein LOC142765391 [Rhipicephalus microplus]|uniref:uncharacterized protein LOC142765391 n=1 Tax=Rhipicephalus microplus TaxID=6941 RepID=UPI003F6BA3F2
MVSDKDLKKIAVVYSLTQALLCCNYIIFGYRSKYGNVRNYMLYFDIFFGTECFLNSCTGVILFSGMQKFRLPKEELAEKPTCHSITKFVDDPLESLRLFIAWAIVAAVLCFCGSVALSMVLKWGDIPSNKLKDDPVLKMHDKLRDRSIFSSIVFYVIYAIFKGPGEVPRCWLPSRVAVGFGCCGPDVSAAIPGGWRDPGALLRRAWWQRAAAELPISYRLLLLRPKAVSRRGPSHVEYGNEPGGAQPTSDRRR